MSFFQLAQHIVIDALSLVLPQHRGVHLSALGTEQAVLLALDVTAVVSSDGQRTVVSALQRERCLARPVRHDGPIIRH